MSIKSAETNLLELMMKLTKSLPYQLEFSTPQGTRYTNDGLSTYVTHIESGKLYKVMLSETDMTKEMPNLFKGKETSDESK